ncbi:hypothetical protein S245_052368, partial [Arachis hypogaea]
LPDSCAPPSVLMNSFKRRVMADLEDIKRANNSIREEQILLKPMIECINSIYVKPELKENERLLKNSKTNPITTPHKTYRTTITRQDPCKVAVQRSIPSIKRQKLSPQPNGKGKAKPLSKPWFLGPSERRTRFQNTVEAFRGVQRPRRMSTSEMDAQVSRGEAVRASSTPVAARVRTESKPLSIFRQQNLVVQKKPKKLFELEHGITTYFKMGGEINLSKRQVEMFAYVFYPDLLPSEHIVKIGDSSATRQELFCLSKDHTITAKIMELWARKCTWDQRIITLKTTWCLPPSFSVVVLSQIISSAHFEACPFKHGDFSGGWSSQTIEVVHDVQPPPTCQEDFALWVLSWLHMEYSFNPKIPPK